MTSVPLQGSLVAASCAPFNPIAGQATLSFDGATWKLHASFTGVGEVTVHSFTEATTADIEDVASETVNAAAANHGDEATTMMLETATCGYCHGHYDGYMLGCSICSMPFYSMMMSPYGAQKATFEVMIEQLLQCGCPLTLLQADPNSVASVNGFRTVRYWSPVTPAPGPQSKAMPFIEIAAARKAACEFMPLLLLNKCYSKPNLTFFVFCSEQLFQSLYDSIPGFYVTILLNSAWFSITRLYRETTRASEQSSWLWQHQRCRSPC